LKADFLAEAEADFLAEAVSSVSIWILSSSFSFELSDFETSLLESVSSGVSCGVS